MAAALNSFGSVASAGAVSGGVLDNKAGKGTVDDDNRGAKTRDYNEVKSSFKRKVLASSGLPKWESF